MVDKYDHKTFFSSKKCFQANMSQNQRLNAIHKANKQHLLSLEQDNISMDSLNEENVDKLNTNAISDQLENILESNKIITVKEVNHYLHFQTEKISINTNYFIHHVKELEELQNSIRSDLTEMKEREINRVGKEFLANDYERVYRVNISTIFSSIVGQQNLYSEMKRFLTEKQDYYKSLQLCRNYNAFNSRYEKIYTNLFNKNKRMKEEENNENEE